MIVLPALNLIMFIMPVSFVFVTRNLVLPFVCISRCSTCLFVGVSNRKYQNWFHKFVWNLPTVESKLMPIINPHMFTMCARKFQKSNLEGARVKHSMRSSLCYKMDYFIIFNKVDCKASSGNTVKL